MRGKLPSPPPLHLAPKLAPAYALPRSPLLTGLCPTMSDVPPLSSATPANATSGRVIRAALIIFPLGTVILGIASFGIWWVKRVQVEERGYKYALALRRDITEAGLARHISILQDVYRQTPDKLLPSVAAYLESSMGPENMGYQVRRDRFQHGGIDLSNVDVELTNKKRFREILLVLVPYGDVDTARQNAEVQALSTLLSVAHAITGESGSQTLRFAAIPAAHDSSSLERFVAAARGKEERFMQVFVLGDPSPATQATLQKAFRVEETGTVIQNLPPTSDAAETLAAAQVLKQRLLDLLK